MAKVSFIIFAEETMTQNQIKPDLLIRNPKISLVPAYIPGQFSFSIVFGLVGLQNKEHYTLRMKFMHKESGAIVAEFNGMEFDFEMDLNDPVSAKTNGTVININMNNVIFEKEGTYEIEMELDGSITRQEIEVLGARSVSGGKS